LAEPSARGSISLGVSFGGNLILTPYLIGAGASRSAGIFGTSIGSEGDKVALAIDPNSAGTIDPSSAGTIDPNSAGVTALA
jgi:hypothetical protein